MSTEVALLETIVLNWELAEADKHTRYRLGKFAAWLTTQGQPWYSPGIAPT